MLIAGSQLRFFCLFFKETIFKIEILSLLSLLNHLVLLYKIHNDTSRLNSIIYPEKIYVSLEPHGSPGKVSSTDFFFPPPHPFEGLGNLDLDSLNDKVISK